MDHLNNHTWQPCTFLLNITGASALNCASNNNKNSNQYLLIVLYVSGTVVTSFCFKCYGIDIKNINSIYVHYKDKQPGASLVAQWLRIRLSMQGTRVRALVREDPTCRGATKPMCHNYCAHALQLLKAVRLEPVLCSKRSPCSLQLQKARMQQRRPKAAKNLKINKIKII